MKIFGIVNLTPDSFSGSNNLKDAHQLLKDGADYLDIGAESTRPNATPITAAEEIKRLSPALEEFKKLPISIDTYKPEVAAHCIKHANVKFINDVSGFENTDMIKLAAQSEFELIIMHSLTVPADKEIILTTPPVKTLQSWVAKKIESLKTYGIAESRMIFDVGLGFGKNAVQCRELVINAPEMAIFCHNLGARLLYGHSRKSFMNLPLEQRDVETAEITRYLAMANVDFVRVHNAAINKTAITGGDLLQT